MKRRKPIPKTFHGLGDHPLYDIWSAIIQRCTNPSQKFYYNYGGRGISICDEWRYDFKSFFDWCMTNGWSHGLQIDRRDNDKGYCPDNCRIVTVTINQGNKRTSLLLEYNGIKLCASAWARELNLHPNTIMSRVKRGWTIKEIIERPRDLIFMRTPRKKLSSKTKTII